MLASGVCKGSSLTGETPSHSVPAAFGRFQVLHQIGAGVLGPVFLARDPDRGRSVAIKAFRLDITPEQAAELASQLTALARANLAHPTIIVPFEAGVEGTVAYLVEDFVGAESLDAAIRQYGPPPTAQAIRIVAAVAGGLDFAAAVGVHHGALHPRDLLVTPDDTRVTGLGVGRALAAIGLRAPMRRPYVAPERVQREGWDARADIYSLGMLARELLVGRTRGESAEARLPDDQAERLQPVLEHATSARAADRFPTALEFIGALQDAVAGKPASASGRDVAVPRPSRGRRTHDVLLPLGDEAAPVAKEQAGATPEALHLQPSDVPEMPPADFAAGAAAGGALADLDLHHEAANVAQPSHGFDLSDLDGHLAAGSDGFRQDETQAAEQETVAIQGVAFDRPPEPSHGQGDGLGLDEAARLPAGQAVVDRAEPGIAEPTIHLDTQPERLGDFVEPGVAPTRTDEQRLALEMESASTGPADADAGDRPARVSSMVAMLLVGILIGAVAGAIIGYVIGARQRSASTATSAVVPSSTAPTPTVPASAPSASAVAPAPSSSVPPRSAGALPSSASPRSARAPSPAPPPAAAAKPAKTVLTVRSTPNGATVLVNGRRRGVTPLRIDDLGPGRYTVRVTRRGFDAEERDVLLSVDRPSSTLAFSLDRSSPPQPATRTAEFYGWLSVESLPSGARVFVDGRLIGTTPLDSARLDAGSHVVRVDRIGFRPWTTPIEIVTGQRHRVTASLEREEK